MKNLFTYLVLILLSFQVNAQNEYPLPSTHVYGSLDVDNYFKNDFQGYGLINDSIDLGPAKLPHVGVGFQYGAGHWLNGAGSWSLVGGKDMESRIGYLSTSGGNFVQIDTTDIKIVASETFTAGILQNDTSAVLNINGSNSAVDQLFSLQASLPNKGPVGFECQVTAGKGTAKMFATSHDGATNLSVIEVDTTSININVNDYGATTKYNENGVVFPNLSSEPTGENGAIYYNTTSNVFRKYANGSWSDL